MAARPSVNVITQLGPETTKGTPVAATHRIPTMNIDLSPDVVMGYARGNGYKNNTKSTRHQASSSGSYDAPLSYGGIVYPLSSLFGKPTPTQIGITTGYTWAFAPVARGVEAG